MMLLLLLLLLAQGGWAGWLAGLGWVAELG